MVAEMPSTFCLFSMLTDLRARMLLVAWQRGGDHGQRVG